MKRALVFRISAIPNHVVICDNRASTMGAPFAGAIKSYLALQGRLLLSFGIPSEKLGLVNDRTSGAVPHLVVLSQTLELQLWVGDALAITGRK